MSFRAICGHDRQIEVLTGALQKNRVPHAYLFYGIEGVGKWTVAREFAKALNCRSGNADACDTCPSCTKIEHETHVDVSFLRPEKGVIRIDAIRSVRQQAACTPLEGRRRVFIIDDADRMNEAAANALLKILEEPQAATMFVLVSSRLSRIPQTVRSRCQQMLFAPLADENVAAFLVKQCRTDVETAQSLAGISGGSIGTALGMAERDIPEARHALVSTLLASDFDSDLPALIAVTERLGREKEAISERLEMLRNWYRDVLLFLEKGAAALPAADAGHAVKVAAERMTVDTVIASMECIEQALEDIERNVNRQLTLESMVFKLSGFLRKRNGRDKTDGRR